MRRLSVLLVLACVTVTTASKVRADANPLFGSADTLQFVLEAPFRTLFRKAGENPVLPGQLRYQDTSGKTVSLDVDITTRGRSRLELCSFPPLSISLNREQAESTLFAGQHKLKIVTHCNRGSEYLTYLFQEFGIYSAYNVLSEYSFRVRMLNITYRDSGTGRKDEVHPAFFIESDTEAAHRLGMTRIHAQTVKLEQLDPVQTSIFGLFQYLIANTDWSIRKGPGAEECCHNGKLIGNPGSHEKWVVLAYDFDQSGLINTSYAMPARSLGIGTVRQRLYRGRCLHNDQLADTISLFNERREEIEAALLPQSLPGKKRKSALSYVEKFYATINDPQTLKKEITDACLRGR